jgi:glucosamine-6-phosphate deaminase
MIIRVFPDKPALARGAAAEAALIITEAIAERGVARIIAATGASQVEFLDALTAVPRIDWRKVETFHLDEYIGLPVTHPASFRKFLQDHVIQKTGIINYHLLDGERDAGEVISRVGRLLNAASIDVAFVGIGENSHLAFNDPPADFETEEPYLVVNLDEACRCQQVGEGWFADLSEVPAQAISMSVRQILKARKIICVAPDARKARAVRACLEDDISPRAPASILRTHPQVTLYLDTNSASLLRREITEQTELAEQTEIL